MKRKYIKPAVVIQDMTINSFVAGECSDKNAIAIGYAENSCTYEDESSWNVYFSDNCESAEFGEWGANIVNPNPQSPFAQLCYHRPLDALAFFSS